MADASHASSRARRAKGAGRSPQRVGPAHAADQLTDFCADSGSSRTARSPPPIEPEALAMPRDSVAGLTQHAPYMAVFLRWLVGGRTD